MSEPRGGNSGARPPRSGGTRPYPGTPGHERPGPRRSSGPLPPRWGALSGRLGVQVVIAGAVLGVVVTVATGSKPGALLGAFLIAATAVAALAVRRRAVYLIIPVPALAYLVAATTAGLIEVHGQAASTSLTEVAVSAVQWIASGFLLVSAATVLAVAATAVRHPRKSRPRGRTRLKPEAGG